MRRVILEAAQRLVEEVGSECQIAVVLRSGDEIQIRDNSGVEGLTGEPLMQKTVAMLEELFPR